MQREVDRYLKFKKAIQDWLLGTGSTSDIAQHIGGTQSSVRDMFLWYGLADQWGKASDGITQQDVMNAIFLSLARRIYALEK